MLVDDEDHSHVIHNCAWWRPHFKLLVVMSLLFVGSLC